MSMEYFSCVSKTKRQDGSIENTIYRYELDRSTYSISKTESFSINGKFKDGNIPILEPDTKSVHSEFKKNMMPLKTDSEDNLPDTEFSEEKGLEKIKSNEFLEPYPTIKPKRIYVIHKFSKKKANKLVVQMEENTELVSDSGKYRKLTHKKDSIAVGDTIELKNVLFPNKK